MKNSKFDAKSFLQVKTLSPLETIAIKGGLADGKQKQKQKGGNTTDISVQL
jgi:hypothetical protein